MAMRMKVVLLQGLVDERPPKKTPMTLPKFRASGQPLDSTSSAQVGSAF